MNCNIVLYLRTPVRLIFISYRPANRSVFRSVFLKAKSCHRTFVKHVRSEPVEAQADSRPPCRVSQPRDDLAAGASDAVAGVQVQFPRRAPSPQLRAPIEDTQSSPTPLSAQLAVSIEQPIAFKISLSPQVRHIARALSESLSPTNQPFSYILWRTLLRNATISERTRVVVDVAYCDWSGNAAELNGHLRRCRYAVVQCAHCKDAMLRKDARRHSLQCPRYPMQCDQCATSIPRCLMAAHLNAECASTRDQLSKCPFSMFGCHAQMKRSEQAMHIWRNATHHFTLLTSSAEQDQSRDLHALVGRMSKARKRSQAVFVEAVSDKLRKMRIETDLHTECGESISEQSIQDIEDELHALQIDKANHCIQL